MVSSSCPSTPIGVSITSKTRYNDFNTGAFESLPESLGGYCSLTVLKKSEMIAISEYK
jgi:hypothetical protein